jgi:hypothetical protein
LKFISTGLYKDTPTACFVLQKIFFFKQLCGLLQFQQAFPAKAILVTFLQELLLRRCEYDAITLAVTYISDLAFKARFAARTGFFFVFLHGIGF